MCASVCRPLPTCVGVRGSSIRSNEQTTTFVASSSTGRISACTCRGPTSISSMRDMTAARTDQAYHRRCHAPSSHPTRRSFPRCDHLHPAPPPANRSDAPCAPRSQTRWDGATGSGGDPYAAEKAHEAKGLAMLQFARENSARYDMRRQSRTRETLVRRRACSSRACGKGGLSCRGGRAW